MDPMGAVVPAPVLSLTILSEFIYPKSDFCNSKGLDLGRPGEATP